MAMQVQIFIPCFIDHLYPETADSMLKVLNHLNIDAKYNPIQSCCGQLFFNSGYWHDACDLAQKFLNDFDPDIPIVSPSASCVAYIKNYFKELKLPEEAQRKYNELSEQLFEFTDFLVNIVKTDKLNGTFNHTVTYHDSCSALREYGIKDEPRQLLNNIEGLTLKEMQDSDVCCGFGGTFAVKNEPVSVAMAEQKTKNALATGVDYIVSTEISCLMHIEAFIKKQRLPIRTISVTDLLAKAIN